MAIKNVILSVTRRIKNGLTAGQIYDRVVMKYEDRGEIAPQYSSVRKALVELQEGGEMESHIIRRDPTSGRSAWTYRRVRQSSWMSNGFNRRS